MNMYFNPETEDIASDKILSVTYNASIPKNTEFFNGYYLIHTQEKPQAKMLSVLKEGNIELIDGHYTRTWIVEDGSLEEMKEYVINEIDKNIEKAIYSCVVSSSIGITVKGSRYVIQNMYYMIHNKKEKYELFDEKEKIFVSIDYNSLSILLNELEENILFMYQQKNSIVKNIMKSKTVEEIRNLNKDIFCKKFNS